MVNIEGGAMERIWWYAVGDVKTGPVQQSDLLQRLCDEQINFDTLVWQPGWKAWQKLADVEEIRTQVLDVFREQRRNVPPPLPVSQVFPSTDTLHYGQSSPPTRAPEIVSSQVRPWTRFWARLFDIYAFSVVFGLLIGVASLVMSPVRIVDKAQEALLGMLALLVWVFVEPIFLASFGTTPGKWLLRITVSTKEGSMSYGKALSRSLKVWWRGLGIGFPLVALFTMAIAAGRLKKNGSTSWDREGGFEVSHHRVGWLRVLGMALLMFVFLVLQTASREL